MNMGTLMILAGYTILMLMFMNFTTLLMFWVMLELNMLIFLLIIWLEKGKEVYSQMLYYFMTQSLGSILFLISGAFSTSQMLEELTLMMELALILKMGVYPLHFWAYKMSENLTKMSFFLILTSQKIPIMMFLAQNSLTSVFLIMIINLLAGSVMILGSLSVKEMMVASSIFMTFWLYTVAILSFSMFMFLMLLYMVMSWGIFKEADNKSMGDPFKKTNFFYSVMFIMGLPPMSLFFLKFYILEMMYQDMSRVTQTLIWTTSFVALLGYFLKFIHSSVIKEAPQEEIKQPRGSFHMTTLLVLGMTGMLTF